MENGITQRLNFSKSAAPNPTRGGPSYLPNEG